MGIGGSNVQFLDIAFLIGTSMLFVTESVEAVFLCPAGIAVFTRCGLTKKRCKVNWICKEQLAKVLIKTFRLPNGLYVLRIGEELIVKRTQTLPGNHLLVSSANEAYQPFELDLADETSGVEIIGKVVWFGRQI